jgi:molecular chaperone GrpE (heat shock protein)
MSRKTSTRPSTTPTTASTTKPAAKVKTKTYEAFPKPTKPAVLGKGLTKPEAPAKNHSTQPEPLLKSSAKQAEPPSKSNGVQAAARGSEATNQVLNRAERDIASAIDSLNTQMNTALTALAELASAQTDRGKAVVRTAPLDRATATFQRLVAEVVDDQLAEMLPPLIALRNETGQWAASDEKDSAEAEFHRRSAETLDHVLTLAGVTSFDARPGQAFDSLIHLAVGECHRDDLADGAVAECLQPGFRSSRGKVLSQARVRINRR